MAGGFGLLRLSSHAFWSMTPRELEAAFGLSAPKGHPPPARSELAALMRAFPDTTKKDARHG